MKNDRNWLESTEAYAFHIATEQLDRIERDLAAHPNVHPDFARTAAALDVLMSALDSQSDPRLNELADVWMDYSSALAIEMYMYGVRDGGRIYHAFATGELPKKENVPNEEQH